MLSMHSPWGLSGAISEHFLSENISFLKRIKHFRMKIVLEKMHLSWKGSITPYNNWVCLQYSSVNHNHRISRLELELEKSEKEKKGKILMNFVPLLLHLTRERIEPLYLRAFFLMLTDKQHVQLWQQKNRIILGKTITRREGKPWHTAKIWILSLWLQN